MNHSNMDGFESYRRQREKLRRMGIGDKRPLSGPSNALRELEAVEAKEERERQLSREMQDFFESATKTAAEIVQKVAESAKVRIDQQLSGEMQDFLLDSITRMQDLITAVLKENTESTAEQVVEPLMHNLVGKILDSFRSAGTAGTSKHLGEDPMATNLEEVRREFQAKMPVPAVTEVQPIVGNLGNNASMTVATDARATIEDHLVAETEAPVDEKHADQEDLQRFRQALDALVRQGSMSKDEAKAALKARKVSRR